MRGAHDARLSDILFATQRILPEPRLGIVQAKVCAEEPTCAKLVQVLVGLQGIFPANPRHGRNVRRFWPNLPIFKLEESGALWVARLRGASWLLRFVRHCLGLARPTPTHLLVIPT